MKHFTRSLLIAALLNGTVSAPAQSQMSQSIAASVDSVIHAELIAKGATSVSLAIARDSEPPFMRVWGVADRESNRPADAETTYRLGSMSKQFTAALVLKQIDRRRLLLTDTIGQYLSGLRPEWTGLTIEQLLNHTAGLPREYRDPKRMAESFIADSLIAMASRSTAAAVPAGSVFGYSNTGYMLLGALVEMLYEKSYGAALRDELARPLGLKTLGWCGDTEANGSAKGYMRGPDGATTAAPLLNATYMLGGAVCSSAGDIALWNRALHNGEVLSPASYAAMTTPRGAAARNGVPYGFGLYVRETLGGGKVIVHDGLTPGYSAENVWYPAESLSVTVIINTSGVINANTNLSEVIGAVVLGRSSVVAK